MELNKILNEISLEEQQIVNERMILAAKIYDAMIIKGWNQKEFAKQMKEDEKTIYNWLSGRYNINDNVLDEIVKILEIYDLKYGV